MSLEDEKITAAQTAKRVAAEAWVAAEAASWAPAEADAAWAAAEVAAAAEAEVTLVRAQPSPKAAPGEQSFLTCGCEKSTTMAVVVIHDAVGAFISALVCPECNSEIPISFGRPQRPK